LPDLHALYRGFSDMPLVSISDAQQRLVPTAGFVKTVHHGIPIDLHRPNFSRPGTYLAFLGRICPEKRPDLAIAIARAMDIQLMIAAKVDKVDQSYFHTTIEPLLKGGGVTFIGEINEQAKTEFLGEALALLFPIEWPEPFGLTMIESMACGTPVLAFRHGSVPEVVDEGVTGFIVDTAEEAVSALPRVLSIDRRAVRRRFEERFSASRMAEEYVNVYRSLRRTSSQIDLADRQSIRTPALIHPLTNGRKSQTE
jgi:glycosyltransferase involved in cell wall biosynthesis